MHQLEGIICYSFKEIEHLSLAMNVIKVTSTYNGKHNKEYKNSGLATVGDAMLKAVLADYLYQNSSGNKGDITITKSALENNEKLTKISKKNGIRKFAYNEKHFADDPDILLHEQLPDNEHDPYIEAIVGAIYYDAGFEAVQRWVTEWLLPKLLNS